MQSVELPGKLNEPGSELPRSPTAQISGQSPGATKESPVERMFCMPKVGGFTDPTQAHENACWDGQLERGDFHGSSTPSEKVQAQTECCVTRVSVENVEHTD